MTREILILTMTGAVDELVGALHEHGDVAVTIVSAMACNVDRATVIHLPVPSLGAVGSRVRRTLWGSAIGRNVFRLTRWDGSRRLQRAIRGDAAARHSISKAHLIVVAERDAAYSAWKAVHGRRAATAQAVYGAVSATAIVDGWRTGSGHPA
ncbi:hypothetical protein JOE59_000739 [Agromyces cerinus]|uniref:hypothetical protein n=1 Tax=Agromyces cerinus TaxID=33878 RepID=UPI0019588D1F|nr:hypothetical protein [Agromyces cerinus]MBM7830034.1 hypothetical protein [Agromyces cerinus]